MMEFMHTTPRREKVHECVYCNQKYPSERDLSIHQYIHESYMRDAIFNLTIQPRNSYLIYEEFNFVCGRMKSGIMFKELGSAETPEQEQLESPDKKEHEKSSSRNVTCHQLNLQEYNEKYFNKKPAEKSSSNILPLHHLTPPDEIFPNKEHLVESSSKKLQNNPHLAKLQLEKKLLDASSSKIVPNIQSFTPPIINLKLPVTKESETTSSSKMFYDNLTIPNYQEQASESRNLFPYKTFEGVYSKEYENDIEIINTLTEDFLVKYGTFPTRSNAKARENWADRYKTSLVSEADGRGDPPIAFSPGIRF